MFIGTKNNNQEKNIMFTICRWVIIMNKGNYGSQYVMLGTVCGIVLMKEIFFYKKICESCYCQAIRYLHIHT